MFHISVTMVIMQKLRSVLDRTGAATRPDPGRACGPLRRSAGAHLPVFTHIGPDSKYTRGSV